MTDKFFFEYPSIDKTMRVVMVLAEEVYILKDRLATLEKALESITPLQRSALDVASTDPAAVETQRQACMAFVSTILAPVIEE